MIFRKEGNPKLRAIARSLTDDRDEQDELYQEMRVHLWETERDHPGQTESWYVQGCRHRAIDYLRRGRSLDSKLRADVCRVDLSGALSDEALEAELGFESGDCETELLLYDLMRRLTNRQQEILSYLREGFSEGEIGRFLAISR